MPLRKEHNNGERMKAFPLRPRRRQGRTLCTTIQQSTETLTAIRWEKEFKGAQIEKEVNLSSFPQDKVSSVKIIKKLKHKHKENITKITKENMLYERYKENIKKITKETCYMKKDSLITTQRINQPINSLSKLPWQSL